MTSGVILAGGAGRRLRPLTDERPKPLVEFRGTPLIDFSLNCLLAAGISDIHAVVDQNANRLLEYLDSKGVAAVGGCAREHIFYAIWRGYAAVSAQAEAIAFLDGDTVCSSSLLVAAESLIPSGADGAIICTTRHNGGSQWELQVDKVGYVTNLMHGKSDKARVVVILRRQLLEAVFSFADGRAPMRSWRYENCFLPGFDSYLLGWGLLFRIALDLKAKLVCTIVDSPVVNVNRPEDLARTDFDKAGG